MKHFLGVTMHIFMPTTSQSCNTSLTLTDVYCYFEACSGKNLDLLCSSFPNEKTTFSELWVSACQTGFRIFRVPYLENLNSKFRFRVLGFVGFLQTLSNTHLWLCLPNDLKYCVD